MEDKQRTIRQNASLHKHFTDISEISQRQGITLKMMMAKLPDADIPMTPAIVKEIWRIFQIKMLNKDSTVKLTTKELDEVLLPFHKFLAENFDIAPPFPSIESIMMNQRLKEEGGQYGSN